MTLIEELKQRGLLHSLTDEALEERLEKESVTFYLGADPSDSSLHVGHLMTYILARRLSERGHQPILLVGGGTGLIGDPSGKREERRLLDFEEVAENAKALATQVKRIIPGARIVNNYDWLKTYDAIGFLRDIGKHFSINDMLAKDSVKSRLESGISFTEFSYQIIQALDYLKLFENENCTLQIGGQDQWGNITAGIELIRRRRGANAKAYGLVAPLLTKSDGSKFGKTADGAVWLDSDRTSPYAFYQYWINVDDAEALDRLKQFTSLSLETIADIEERMAASPHERHAQKALAEEMTTLLHGEEALKQVQRITQALFSGDVRTLSAEEIEMGFEGVPWAESAGPINIIDALVETSLAKSKREARTFIKQNAVRVNDVRIEDIETELAPSDAIEGAYHVIRRGKKRYALLKHV